MGVMEGDRGMAERPMRPRISPDGAVASGKPLAGNREHPQGSAAAEEKLQLIEQALQRLHEQHRAVIRMRNFEGLPFSGIAQRMGRSADAARNLWVTAIERLQTELELLNEYR